MGAGRVWLLKETILCVQAYVRTCESVSFHRGEKSAIFIQNLEERFRIYVQLECTHESNFPVNEITRSGYAIHTHYQKLKVALLKWNNIWESLTKLSITQNMSESDKIRIATAMFNDKVRLRNIHEFLVSGRMISLGPCFKYVEVWKELIKTGLLEDMKAAPGLYNSVRPPRSDKIQEFIDTSSSHVNKKLPVSFTPNSAVQSVKEQTWMKKNVIEVLKSKSNENQKTVPTKEMNASGEVAHAPIKPISKYFQHMDGNQPENGSGVKLNVSARNEYGQTPQEGRKFKPALPTKKLSPPQSSSDAKLNPEATLKYVGKKCSNATVTQAQRSIVPPSNHINDANNVESKSLALRTAAGHQWVIKQYQKNDTLSCATNPNTRPQIFDAATNNNLKRGQPSSNMNTQIQKRPRLTTNCTAVPAKNYIRR